MDDIERTIIQRRDWRAIIHCGASFFMLEKFGSVIGVSNMHIYAAMRGESLEALRQTCNVQVVYSTSSEVLGNEAGCPAIRTASVALERPRPYNRLP